MESNNNLAVVIGSGIGGLGAASALSNLFHNVLVLEKDQLPLTPGQRKGVPQGGHLHSLLMGGLRHLEYLYPGFREILLENGAVQLRASLDQKIFEYGQWLPQRDLGLEILAQSRALLEHLILQQTSALDNVKIEGQCRVKEIAVDSDGNVIGVQYIDKDGQSRELNSKVVVDCSGVGGFFARQLAQNFPGLDNTETISSNIVYTTFFLQKPKAWLHQKENVQIIPEPHHSAGGALLDVENDTWCVSLHGRNGLSPPVDLDAWKEFARSMLPDQAIWERIKDAEAIADPTTFKKPHSLWRRFDTAENIPSGYYPLGDTISSLNPIFGHGMTVALGHAISLQKAFQEHEDPQLAYLKSAAGWSRKAWQRVKAYDSLFTAEKTGSFDTDQVRKLALLRHKQFSGNSDLYRDAVKQGQMLFS